MSTEKLIVVNNFIDKNKVDYHLKPDCCLVCCHCIIKTVKTVVDLIGFLLFVGLIVFVVYIIGWLTWPIFSANGIWNWKLDWNPLYLFIGCIVIILITVTGFILYKCIKEIYLCSYRSAEKELLTEGIRSY